MFDRFSDRARLAIGNSKVAAQRRNHASIGTEHLLLGLLQDDRCTAVKILVELNVDPKRVESDLDKKFVHLSSGATAPGMIPFTPRAKRVLELAVEEATNLGHRELGTAHLLLGLIDEGDGIAARVLANLGVGRDSVRERVSETRGSDARAAPVSAAPADRPAPAARNLSVRFTDRVNKALRLAKSEAKRMRHDYVSTEHLLLGLAAEGSGVACHVLRNRNIHLARIQKALEKFEGGASGVAAGGDLHFTPRAQAVIELASEEADALDHAYIGTEHLLLGLIREGQGIAALVLRELGANLEEMRHAVLEFIGEAPRPTLQKDVANPSTASTRARMESLGAKVADGDPAAIPALVVRKSTLRIGVVGADERVLRVHLPGYRKWGLNVTAITDGQCEAAEAAARQNGIGSVCATIEELLARDDVDVVDLAASELDRTELLPKLLKAGKPVLLQKPLAGSLEDARRIVDDFARAKVPLAVNQSLRWSPEMQAAKHLIAGGHLGRVFDLRWTMRNTTDQRAWAKASSFARRSRFQVVAWSIHHLDAFRFLLDDEASRVYCVLPRRPDQNFEGEVCATAVIRFRGGAHVSMVDSNAVTRGRPEEQVLDVDGTGGSLAFGLARPRHFAYWLAREAVGESDAPAHAPILIGAWHPDGFAGSMASFLEAVERGVEAPTSGRRNLGTMALVDACYRSAENGQAVDVPVVD